MKQISGKDLSGLTEAELFEEIVTNNKCPNNINDNFLYKDCETERAIEDNTSCCVFCWRENLNKAYSFE